MLKRKITSYTHIDQFFFNFMCEVRDLVDYNTNERRRKKRKKKKIIRNRLKLLDNHILLYKYTNDTHSHTRTYTYNLRTIQS